MEGQTNLMGSLWQSIKAAIAWVEVRLKAGNKMQSGDEKLLNALAIPFKVPKEKRVCIVKWQKPVKAWFKLNVDGSSLGNPCRLGAGGFIRDDEGRLKLVFSIGLGHGTNNSVEPMALLHGLRYCRELGLVQLEMELDALLVVHWLEKKLCGIWYLEEYWEEIQWHLSKMQVVVRHVLLRPVPEGPESLLMSPKNHFPST
ncbi:uncharacterized protein LOC121244159 [Juglans microcarpa x Juglans regia]|uniref:uncharacterized protein LOC121244159 n=1 Tax=Juglans microcarpa x Juglans regia TaxID=2249226 RepID=UPI001B7EFF8E|nr:uncharacterized protein LOC121244159 [Juglans microcarpa x Juglans regia]